ncbi:RNA 2',3'-cyclic phosphodiesterase [Pseudonocardia acaciae]|uniref:RNA 2',3'-cyclic phosphodiesterase n=1 Tax=Pseudonocardia acaciae TaxID=551276 RepID=UPI00048C8EF5|nr:RNA 2',3'-cyclic phosphodiesterase [Pseudonocardia acaciae]
MRLFVALVPPAEAVDELWGATERLRGQARPGLRWTRPEQWHLTLAFLAEVDDPTRADLCTRLERVAARAAPLSLELGAGGRFGDRVLWARVRGDTDRLRKLAASVRAAARRVKLPVEDRPYRPHLTLARANGTADLRPAVTGLANFEGSPWTASELHLVRSRLAAGPGRTSLYDSVERWPLSAER